MCEVVCGNCDDDRTQKRERENRVKTKRTVKIKIPLATANPVEMLALQCIELVSAVRVRRHKCNKKTVSLRREIYDPEHPVIAVPALWSDDLLRFRSHV